MKKNYSALLMSLLFLGTFLPAALVFARTTDHSTIPAHFITGSTINRCAVPVDGSPSDVYPYHLTVTIDGAFIAGGGISNMCLASFNLRVVLSADEPYISRFYPTNSTDQITEVYRIGLYEYTPSGVECRLISLPATMQPFSDSVSGTLFIPGGSVLTATKLVYSKNFNVGVKSGYRYAVRIEYGVVMGGYPRGPLGDCVGLYTPRCQRTVGFTVPLF